jgi:hypothetical protein
MTTEDALIILFGPPLIAAMLALVAVVGTGQRSIRAWLAATIAGWVGIRVLPGLHDVIAGDLAAFAAAGTGLFIRRLGSRGDEPVSSSS